MPSNIGTGFYKKPTLWKRAGDIHWMLLLVVTAIAGVGVAMLYSVAQGDFDSLAYTQLTRFGIGLCVLLAVSLVHIRVWYKLSYPIYGIVLLLLVAVEVMGITRGGAQRWVDLGFMVLQPSELMKLALVMALARFFHGRASEEVRQYRHLIIPTLMIAVPCALVVRQPDLGTTLLLTMGGVAILFIAGVKARLFAIAAMLTIVAIPIGMNFFMKDYQVERVMTFLNPDRDPLGSGYHANQSMIALGSGGVSGKGYMQGTQVHLDFLPEKQTDFIFTALAEEFGFMGGLFLLGLYLMVLVYAFRIALSSRNHFGRLLAIGMATTLFLYVFINVAMVMGLVPVVGVPLPMVSYGGSAMLTVLVGLGFVMSVHLHRDVLISRQGHAR
jgi:rod shape determining protein RodA